MTIVFLRPWPAASAESSVGRPSFIAEFGLWDDRQKAAAEQIAACLGEVELVRVVFCDPHGLARSKTLPAGVFASVLRNGLDFSPGPFLFDTGHAVAVDFLSDPGVGVGEITGAGDFVLVPDPWTFHLLPHTEPKTAWVLGDEFLRDGSPHPLSSRNVLRRVCGRYAARDLVPVIGLEVEWYLTRLLGGSPGNEGNGFGSQGPAPEVAAVNAGYQFNLDSFYDSVASVTDPLASMLMSLGLPLRSMEHESGPGQIETTFSPMTALDAADAMLLFRTVVKQACARRGYHASFMALPRLASFDPSGWHLHQSVVSTKTQGNVFAADSAGQALPREARAYIDGLIRRAREYCLLSVPTVNGYRRLLPEFALSPSTPNWNFENRSAMIRVLGGDGGVHVENRVGEPCANPYLAMSAQLSAGLDGLAPDESAGPPAPGTGPGGTLPGGTLPGGSEPGGAPPGAAALPTSLREALTAFAASSGAAELLGPSLASCLAKLKESEVSRFEAWRDREQPPAGEVTEWEHREYFRVY
jgi:glutamine synthetase